MTAFKIWERTFYFPPPLVRVGVGVRKESERVRVNRVLPAETERWLRYLPLKHRLIFMVGYKTGLRVSDIISLPKSVLDKERTTIKERKTGKSKRIYIPRKLRAELKDYADIFSKNSNFIFASKSKSGHISRQAVHKMFKKWARILHLHGNISTHSARKSYACNLKLRGKDVEYIKRMLNHSNSVETLLYILDEITKKEQ